MTYHDVRADIVQDEIHMLVPKGADGSLSQITELVKFLRQFV